MQSFHPPTARRILGSKAYKWFKGVARKTRECGGIFLGPDGAGGGEGISYDCIGAYSEGNGLDGIV